MSKHTTTLCVDCVVPGKRGGDKTIKLKKRGRGSAEQRMLNKVQEDELKKLLINENPQQLKLHFALWNKKVVKL